MIKSEKIDKFDVNSIAENSSNGYILEVDLMNCMNCIMIIHKLQKNVKLVTICCQNIVVILLKNMK